MANISDLKETVSTIHSFDLSELGYSGYYLSIPELDLSLPKRDQYYYPFLHGESGNRVSIQGVNPYPDSHNENPISVEEAAQTSIDYLLSELWFIEKRKLQHEKQIDSAIDEIEDPTDYLYPTNGLTRTEKGFIKGEITRTLHQGINGLKTDNSTSAAEMSWHIEYVLDEDQDNSDDKRYTAVGYVVFPDIEGNIKSAKWYCTFTENVGINATILIPELPPEGMFPDLDLTSNGTFKQKEDSPKISHFEETHYQPDIQKITSTRKDITVHVYDLPSTPYEGEYKAFVFEPDSNASHGGQHYQMFVGTSDREYIRYFARVPKGYSENGNSDYVIKEQYLLNWLFDVDYMHKYPFINDLTAMLEKESYLSSEVLSKEVLPDMLYDRVGKVLLISKDNNMLDYSYFGIIVDYLGETRNRAGSITILKSNGKKLIMSLEDMISEFKTQRLKFASDELGNKIIRD